MTLTLNNQTEKQGITVTQQDNAQSLAVEQVDNAQEIPVSPDVKFLRGADGTTFTPHVDEEGNLSWTNDRGFENPEAVNIKGPQGDAYVITDTDKQEIVDGVLAALPVYGGEVEAV